MKFLSIPEDVELEAANALKAMLMRVPAITVEQLRRNVADGKHAPEIDIVAEIRIGRRRHTIICEVKSNGQPRYVRSAIAQLRDAQDTYTPGAILAVIAPYLSEDAQRLCHESGVGFLDLVGNAYLAFDSIHIDRQVATKPAPESRGLKSLFGPRSARVLRKMLEDPGQPWRVVDLAEDSGVSIGLVSNVRKALLEREWASVDADGLVLSDPDGLLDAWSADYQVPAKKRFDFYTPLHGRDLQDRLKQIMSSQNGSGVVTFSSYSAAQWIAPYARTGTTHLYADAGGLARIRSELDLATVPKGGNISVIVPKDEGIFMDLIEPATDVICTNAVQTYLDLNVSGERGVEAADHLRRTLLDWRKA
ncbi:type IV toxin-antitoxin system AbiEi family antitoxin [Stenotrophomonas lactitubi]|jgi:hypothetical protein|uniref:type IV toxin-antitoxin system AbiEi family antitoxin n=1 Tax=Stenotrophomonas lactitubi TaxID=2045214 RepID=UPI00289AD569|nr:type IV toxin-antitoxin system AbiEi family antitoxin [Stenotrophomonas lactitubi]